MPADRVRGQVAIAMWRDRTLRAQLAAAALFAWTNAQFVGYIKDDAYISLRYARHLAEGRGLVFNLDDRPLEGFTNFLWVIAEAVGFLFRTGDGGDLARGLSVGASALLLVFAWRLATQFARQSSMVVPAAATCLLAVHPMIGLWSQGGLAGPLLATAVAATVYHLGRLHACLHGRLNRDGSHHLAATALWCTIACLTRPEGHVVWLAAALYIAAARSRSAHSGKPSDTVVPAAAAPPLPSTIRAATIAGTGCAFAIALGRPQLVTRQLVAAAPALAALAVGAYLAYLTATAAVRRLDLTSRRRRWLCFVTLTAPALATYHVWRLLYFGDLFPNTSYVKLAGGWALSRFGASALRDWLEFCGTGVLLVLAGLSVVASRERAVSRLAGGLVCVFAVYFVAVGGDEMPYHRLVLPAVPLIAILAANGLETALSYAPPRSRKPVLFVSATAIAVACIAIDAGHGPQFAGVREGLRQAQEAMARYVAARSTRGDGIVFQDMGIAPFTADEMHWIDPIGLVDRTVGRARARYGVNPFHATRVRGPDALLGVEFRAAMRDYLLGAEPKWIAAVVYVGDRRVSHELRELGPSGDWQRLEPLISPLRSKTPHYHKLLGDPRFARRYAFERLWRRGARYWILLFRSRQSLAIVPRQTQPKSRHPW